MRTLATLTLGVLLFLGPSALWSAFYRTNLVFHTPVANPNSIDTVQIDWSTNETTGSIFSPYLGDLVMRLVSGGSTVYSDTIIVGGVAQPIGGAGRTFTDIAFIFDLDTLTLRYFRNTYSGLLSTSSGSQIVVSTTALSPAVIDVTLEMLVDGVPTAVTTDLLASQSTITAGTVVPEPATVSTITLVFVTLILGSIRRKSNSTPRHTGNSVPTKQNGTAATTSTAGLCAGM